MTDLRKAAEIALDALENADYIIDMADEHYAIDHEDRTKLITALRQALAQPEQEPVGNEVKLNIIRWWPDGFAERLDHVWKDLEGFIPNYKLHDLQLLLAEYGFTMKVYKGEAPSKPWVSLTDDDKDRFVADLINSGFDFIAPIYTLLEKYQAALRSKNNG